MSLKIKTSLGGTYSVPSNRMEFIWGDYLYFQITSTPADYELELMEIVVTTEDETIILGEMFIDSYVQNQKNTVDGELTFEMMISGEAGLSSGLLNLYIFKKHFIGKKFNLQFLTKSTATSRRLLYGSLERAAISGIIEFISVLLSATKLALGLLVLLLVLLA